MRPSHLRLPDQTDLSDRLSLNQIHAVRLVLLDLYLPVALLRPSHLRLPDQTDLGDPTALLRP